MRYERKYILERAMPEAWLAWLYGLPPAFRTSYPPRQINNIYFDNFDLTSYQENSAGISRRSKYRMRWYGDAYDLLPQPVLEIKTKEALLGEKTYRQLPDTSWGELPALFRQMPELTNSNLRPVLVNAYRRQYLESADGRFRLTLDSELRFGPYTRKAMRFDFQLPGICILELKYAAASDDEIDDITQHWPFRMTRFSKYSVGMQLIMD
jgi:SPX domain protein involved in polyphosphate accumulation